MLCTNRPEGFGPLSHLYSHTLTSCFLDTILVPLCTWLYLLALLILFLLPSRRHTNPTDQAYTPGLGFRRKRGLGARKEAADVDVVEGDALGESAPVKHKRSKAQLALAILYFLLLAAQILMCVLEIARLSLAHYGIGLLPFTFVTLILAGAMRLTRGLGGKVGGWRWANVGVWVALAVCNGVKIAEETKEGIQTRKGTKYPESDEIIDVAVMVGVYVALAILEVIVRR